MGAGIAQIAAAVGHPVFLYDVNPSAARRAIQDIGSALQRLVAKGKLAEEDRLALIGRITPCEDLGALSPASLVVEAIVEDLEVKRGVFRDLEDIVGEDAILASNTSSISITSIGSRLRRAERLVGMHFFNPVPIMKLVEVVSGLATAPEVAETVFATEQAWGKQPVHAKSTPGFIVNRVARPFYAEGLRVLQEGGGDVATLDAVMREAGGFRMGPFELMDMIGHDVNFEVTRTVYNAYYQDARFTPSLIQQELVAAGFLGRKSGQGFYRYGEGAERPEPSTAPMAPLPWSVTVHGRQGPLQALTPLLETVSNTQVSNAEMSNAEEDVWLEVDGRVAVVLTDGRTATQRMAAGGRLPLVLVDLALDYAKAPRVALAAADQTVPEDRKRAVGLFQALGKAVSVLDDVPGMIVMRTVCMLANEAADTVYQGVCSAEAVDTAMRGGVNYPRGPMAWAEDIGIDRLVAVLDNMCGVYGEDRYRVSPLLRRKMFSNSGLL
jgi:3-hydroxybutyryl-CoA dehydrogenase